MKRLLTLLILFFLLARAGAEAWHSDEYHCALLLPDTEAWQRGSATRLPAGEMIFSAANMETKQAISVIVIPDFPTSDINNPAVITRVMECIKAQGFSLMKQEPMEWLGRPFIQFTSQREDAASGQLTSVARAAMSGNSVYLVNTYARGDENRAKDERFLRVLETFRFLEMQASVPPEANPLFRRYRLGYMTCAGVLVALVAVFATVMFFTRRHGWM